MTPTPDQLPPRSVELAPRRGATPAGLAARESLRLGRLGGYTLDEIQQIANVAAKAQMFRGLSPEQAIIKIIAGLELNLPIIQALSSIDVFDGGIQTRSNTLAAMVRRHPLHKYKIREWDDEHCIIDWWERETKDEPWESSGPPTKFDLADAKRAGLLDNPKKPAWQTYPRSMLRNRAIAEGARAYCGDALSNVYDRDEVDPDEYSVDADYARYEEKINRPRRAAAAVETIDGEAEEIIDVDPNPSTTSAPPEGGPAPTSATAPPAQPEPDAHSASSDATTSAAPAEPTGSLLDIIGSNYAEPGWRPISRAQQAHLRTIAMPLDSDGLGRVLAWATRDDGSQATSEVEHLREPRYQELKHVLENAPKGHPDRAALVRTVQAWEESTGAAPGASSSEGRDVSPETGPVSGDAPTDPDGQGRLA